MDRPLGNFHLQGERALSFFPLITMTTVTMMIDFDLMFSFPLSSIAFQCTFSYKL
jgi:hypothetical protein